MNEALCNRKGLFSERDHVAGFSFIENFPWG